VPTTTTVPRLPTTTTTVKIKKKYNIIGGKGSSVIDGGVLAATSERNSAAESDRTFIGQGAIAVFDEEDSPLQISVGWDEYNALNGEARIATGDIDGDGEEEIIIGLGSVEGHSGIPGGKFQILDDDFTSLGWGQIDWSEYNSINGESWPACGDIDGDGVDEILIGLGIGGNGRVEVFNFDNGQAVHAQWIKVGWEEYCLAGGGVRPACGNIDFDRKDEIILGLYPVNDFMPEGKFEVLDGNARHLAWGVVDWPDYNALNGETRPVCGNIDRTAHDEILLGLGTHSEGRIPVYAYAMGTVTLKRWLEAGTSDYRPENGETRLACRDTDDDGLDEILVGFGPGSQGMLELHDDGVHDFSIISSLQMPDADYNSAIGETYPAIRGIKNKYPRIADFLLKLFTNKSIKEP
jgi:hypothetical protein